MQRKKKSEKKQGRGRTAVLGQGKASNWPAIGVGRAEDAGFHSYPSKEERLSFFQGVSQDDQGETSETRYLVCSVKMYTAQIGRCLVEDGESQKENSRIIKISEILVSKFTAIDHDE